MDDCVQNSERSANYNVSLSHGNHSVYRRIITTTIDSEQPKTFSSHYIKTKLINDISRHREMNEKTRTGEMYIIYNV
jgi:hypothetical protein